MIIHIVYTQLRSDTQCVLGKLNNVQFPFQSLFSEIFILKRTLRMTFHTGELNKM